MFDESYHYCLDYEYWVRLLAAGEKCYTINQPLAAFRMHASSKTISENAAFKPERARIHQSYQTKFPNDQVHIADNQILLHDAYFLTKDGKMSEARNAWIKAFRHLPRNIFNFKHLLNFGWSCMPSAITGKRAQIQRLRGRKEEG